MIGEINREQKKKKAAYLPKNDLFANWLPFVQAYRTLCLVPTFQMKVVFNDLRQLGPVS